MTALASRPAAEWFEKLPTAAIGFASAARNQERHSGARNFKLSVSGFNVGQYRRIFSMSRNYSQYRENSSENDDVWGLELLV
jgi:hypothetical protein